MAVIVTVHGPSGSGKTTLIEQLIPRLQARGLSVGVIKHAHDGFAWDPKGKDSWRMWQAGAHTVLVASPQEVVVRERLPAAPSAAQAGRSWSTLRELLDLLPQHLDCVLIEGFTQTAHALDVPVSVRVELAPEGVRLNGQPLCCDDVATAVAAAVMSRPKATAVTVKVLLFAQLKDRLGTDELLVSLPYGSTGKDLMRHFVQQHPKADGLLEVSRLAVNWEYVPLDRRLQDGDEAVIIPPVSGG